MCPSSTGARYQLSASPVLCTENASTCTSCFLNAKIAISRLGGLSPRNHAMQRTRVELISDAATLDYWGFAFKCFSYSSRVTSWSVMWISYCMQSLDPLLLNAIVSHQVGLHNKAVCLCSARERDLQKFLQCFDMNCNLGRFQSPKCNFPFHRFHFERNLQKKLGSLGSVGPLHLIDAAVLNHRFKWCLASDWLQSSCHFEARLAALDCLMKGLRRMLRLSGQCWPRKPAALKIHSVCWEHVNLHIHWMLLKVMPANWGYPMTCQGERPLW